MHIENAMSDKIMQIRAYYWQNVLSMKRFLGRETISKDEEATEMQSLVLEILIEVLWDIETIEGEGRQRGERTIESVLCRADLVTKEVVEGEMKAKLKYDAREGFDEPHGDVWILQDSICLVEDNVTQLRWSFYECSRQVGYDTHGEDIIRQSGNDACNEEVGENPRIYSVEGKIAALLSRVEGIEGMVLGQVQFFSRIASRTTE